MEGCRTTATDALRRPLRGVVADRAGETPDALATIAGMHCESGDVLVRDTELAAPAVGDVLVTLATGAYGYAMANNYNGVPRPPVIFCRDGDARVVVRRETWDDLLARDEDDRDGERRDPRQGDRRGGLSDIARRAGRHGGGGPGGARVSGVLSSRRGISRRSWGRATSLWS